MGSENTLISEQLRQLIRQSSHSRYRICQVTGINQAQLSRFMSGKSGLSLVTIDKLAQFLELKLGESQPTLVELSLPDVSDKLLSSLAIVNALIAVVPYDPASGPWQPPHALSIHSNLGTMIMPADLAEQVTQELVKANHKPLVKPIDLFNSSSAERSEARAYWFGGQWHKVTDTDDE